jgi:hypothetical protein
MRVSLSPSQSWSEEVGAAGVEVRISSGEVWITRERDPEDHLLAGPAVFRSDWRGRLALLALTPVRLEIRCLAGGAEIPAPPGPPLAPGQAHPPALPLGDLAG